MTEENDNPFTAMMNVMDALAPLVETAKGMRVQLENEGWSSHAAEKVATEFLCGSIYMAMRGKQ